ncbi:class I SAM-dependent methyltransferase [Sulfuricystis multivorans]|uniref:class I SAM-dependent methyltransferase n=1 Tax=Sulfuricystis multivorans TaxID=2211108 RepID=UPI000F824553|nr:class I SAM-dependent methyltransferase [Sulfuricystis multivorans]
MSKEIVYDKYRQRGDYHWRQMSRNPLHMSAYVRSRYRHCIDLFETHAGSLAGKRIIDFGCGDGAFAYWLTQYGAQVVGIDPTHEAIVLGRKRHLTQGSQAILLTASGYATPFADASFDGLISSDVIEHVQHPDRFLAEIHRLLKPGGWAVISTPIRLSEKPMDRLHVVEWFPNEFQALIRSVFANADFHRSHPVFWGELSRRSKLLRIATNLLSLFADPFAGTRKWGLFELQYAVCQKAA